MQLKVFLDNFYKYDAPDGAAFGVFKQLLTILF